MLGISIILFRGNSSSELLCSYYIHFSEKKIQRIHTINYSVFGIFDCYIFNVVDRNTFL